MRMIRAVLATVAAVALAMSSVHGDERSFVYSEVIVAGATLVNAQGINAGGDIVGTYKDAAKVSHAFVLKGNRLTTIDYPNAAATEGRGIGSGGAVVGTYWMPSEVGVPAAIHGFLLTRDGVFSEFRSPDHINSIAQRILPDGTILGCFHDHDTMGSMVGALLTAHLRGDRRLRVDA